MSARSEDLPACQVQHVQDASDVVDDDRAASDVSGEGGAAGDVGGPVEGGKESAELLALVRVASEVGGDGGPDVVVRQRHGATSEVREAGHVEAGCLFGSRHPRPRRRDLLDGGGASGG